MAKKAATVRQRTEEGGALEDAQALFHHHLNGELPT
jgi:hypothetical protein